MGSPREFADETILTKDESPTPRRTFGFSGECVFVTWSRSTIANKDDFHRKLVSMMPPGVKIFGGREYHQDGKPHYHVVLSFPAKVKWPDARKMFILEGDTTAVRITPPWRGQRIYDFLNNTQTYAAKKKDTFGERIHCEGSGSSDEETYPSIVRAFGATKLVKLQDVEQITPVEKFRVPLIMEQWMQKHVIDANWKGRPRCLVVVGDPMVGKTRWAQSQGRPIVMNSGWCLKSVFPGATHLVVNDCKPAAFGYGGKSYWREVLGGQDRFHCRDFQQETRVLDWGLPCIWICNFDNDPRKDRAVAQYLKSVGDVIEIRDRPGMISFGKLFEPEPEEKCEVDEERAAALAEAAYYCEG